MAANPKTVMAIPQGEVAEQCTAGGGEWQMDEAMECSITTVNTPLIN